MFCTPHDIPFRINECPPEYQRKWLLFFELKPEHRYFEFEEGEKLDIKVHQADTNGHPGPLLGSTRVPATYGPHLWRYQAEICYFQQYRKHKIYLATWYSVILDYFAAELLRYIEKGPDPVTNFPEDAEWLSPSLWPLVSRAMYGLADDDLGALTNRVLVFTDIRLQKEDSTWEDVTEEDVDCLYQRNPFSTKYLNSKPRLFTQDKIYTDILLLPSSLASHNVSKSYNSLVHHRCHDC
jgi:hypothetical protein